MRTEIICSFLITIDHTIPFGNRDAVIDYITDHIQVDQFVGTMITEIDLVNDRIDMIDNTDD